ncbi:MAG: 6-hydroxymethylpterin diphosphokinase MptE-like protein [Candidatus Hydrothermarchaeales archaeon]
MRYGEWERFYLEILAEFGFSEEDDVKAAVVLDEILKDTSQGLLEERIRNRRVNVYGAGPSLESMKNFPTGVNITADGSTSFLLEKKIIPEVIVTDLDGRLEDLIHANDRGSIIVVHAHGGNIEAIKRHAPKFKNVVGTAQVRPVGKLYNFGGFTDGDRAVFMAEHFKAKEVHLYGMDFHGKTGRYSFSADSEIKRKKLLWAEKLINYLIKQGAKVSYEG